MYHPNETCGRRWWHESGDRYDWRDFRRGEKRIGEEMRGHEMREERSGYKRRREDGGDERRGERR